MKFRKNFFSSLSYCYVIITVKNMMFCKFDFLRACASSPFLYIYLSPVFGNHRWVQCSYNPINSNNIDTIDDDQHFAHAFYPVGVNLFSDGPRRVSLLSSLSTSLKKQKKVETNNVFVLPEIPIQKDCHSTSGKPSGKSC